MPCTQLHTNGGDTTEFLRSSQISRGTKSARFVRSAAPPAVQPFEPQSTHVTSLSLSRISLLSSERVASPATLFRVLCAYARIAQGFTLCYYSREVLHCLVRRQSLACFLDCIFLQIVSQGTCVRSFCSPNLLGLCSCANKRDQRFSTNQRVSSRRDNSFVINLFKGLASVLNRFNKLLAIQCLFRV